MFGIGARVNTPEIVKEMQNQEALLVDVRGDDEWRDGHATGALHLAVDRIIAGELPTSNTQTKIYLYCASGGRAGAAEKILKRKGFATKNLGGLSAWQKSGGGVEY
jgi:phage shock protein E